MMKKKLALIMLVSCLMIATPLNASPLYGGYNGQSTFWVDLFFFGIDDQIQWWVRVPVPLVQGFLNLNFKYESSGAISAEIAGHDIFAAEEGFYAGIDTAGVLWFELSDLGVSGGTDTSGNSWAEQAFLEFLGTGSDNNDRLWGFAVYDFEGYQLKAGIDLSFLITEPSMAGTSIPLQSAQQTPPFLSRMFQGEKRQELITFITALSRDEGLRKKVENLDVHSLDLQSLLKFAEEEVFTEEKRKEIESMVGGLINPGG